MKDERLYLVHIKECITDIEEYASPGYDHFLSSKLNQDAIIRKLQIMAESTMQLSEASKAAFPEVSWGKIRGFRNVIVHDYLNVDLDIVWDVIQEYLPQLKAAVEVMLQQPGASGDNSEA